MARRIGGFRDIGDPNDPRRRVGPRPMGPAAPGMPGYDEPAAIRAWGELIRRRLAEQDAQRSGDARTYLAKKGIPVEPEAVRRSEFDLKDPSAAAREALEALALSESVRHSPAYYDPQLSKFDSTKPSRPTPQDPGPWRNERANSAEEDPDQLSLFNTAAYATNLGGNTGRASQSAPRRSGYSTQALLFDPAAYAARAEDSAARAIQAITEGNPQGSIYAPMPGEGGAIRLPYATAGEDGSELAPAPAFDRRTGLEPLSLADAIRRDALRGSLFGNRITQDDVNAGIAAGYTVLPARVATANAGTIPPGGGPGVSTYRRPMRAASPETRPDVSTYQKPDGSTGYLVNLAADGSDILQLEENDLRAYANAREGRMERRSPWSERHFDPTPSPVIRAFRAAGRDDLLPEIRTPKDLRRYDFGQASQWRKLRKATEDPKRTKRGNLLERTVPPGGETDARGSRAATGDLLSLVARGKSGAYGIVRVDPLETVLTRSLDPDNTASWKRQQEVSLAQLVGELNDKYKTPVLKGYVRDGVFFVDGPNGGRTSVPLESFTARNYATDPVDPESPGVDSRVGRLRKTVRIDEKGVVDPAFQGLDLPEVRAAVQANASLPRELQKHAIEVDLPVYEVRGPGPGGEPTGLHRVGLPAKRNTDALLGELGRLTGGRLYQASGLPLPLRIARIQQLDYRNYNTRDTRAGFQALSDLDIEDARSRGYSFAPADEHGLIAYSDPSGEVAGYLVPKTIFKKGSENTGKPIPNLSPRQPRFIQVPKDHEDWTVDFSAPLAGSAEGVALLSDQAGIRKHVEKSDLNPEGWNTFDLLDAIASYAGAEYPVAPITGGFEQFADPAVPGVFDVALGAGARNPTTVQRVLDATQTLANRAHYVQPAIPGALRGVQSAPWLRRREAQGPSLGEIMERGAGGGQYALDPSQLAIPGLDPDSIPRPLPDPTPADYDAAMRRTIAARILNQKPRLESDSTGTRAPFRGYAERIADYNAEVDGLARQIAARMSPARSVGPSIDGRGFVLVRTSPDRPSQEQGGYRFIGQERPLRSVTPLREVLARPEMDAPEAQFDPEEVGLETRQPMWSDFADISEGGNAGYSVVRLPGSADSPRGRGAAGAAVDVTERAGRAATPYAGSNYYGLGGDTGPYQRPMTAAGAAGGFHYGVMAQGLGAMPGSLQHDMAMAQMAGRVAARRRAAAAGAQRTVTPQVEQMGFLP